MYLEMLAKAIPESQTSVKIGNDSGLKSVDDPILPGCPKKGNGQIRRLIDIGELLLSNLGKSRLRKREKCQKLAMMRGLNPLMTQSFLGTQKWDQPK